MDAPVLPPCRGCGETLVKRWGGSLYCPKCYEARYHPSRVRPPRPDPPPCKGCGEPLIQRAGNRLYHPRCAYLRYSAAYEKQATLGGASGRPSTSRRSRGTGWQRGPDGGLG